MVPAYGSHLHKQATRARQTPTAEAAPHFYNPMTEDPSAKSLARKAARERRVAAFTSNPDAARLLAAIGVEILGDRGFAAVGGYWPIRTEIDPLPLLRALGRPGTVLCLPAVVGPGALQFREWQGGGLEAGPLGTSHPPEGGALIRPDLVLVPLLAFDRRRHRLGYGAGYYDQTLKALRESGPVLAVGVAYAAQEVDEVPIDPWDQALDLILTEAGAITGA